MGVNLTPIIVKRVLSLGELKGRVLAVDAHNVLHQFLALIRTPLGQPLRDQEGRITSHLVGLAFRSTRLMADYDIWPIYIFDGKPPRLKLSEIEKRREVRMRAEREYLEALARGDYATAFSKAVMTGRLTGEMIEDAKRLLNLLGIPWIQAPSEGEAQAAYMASKGDVWAVNSRDYDSLLFGAPRLVRYVTIQGEEYLPSKGMARRLEPELIELDRLLSAHDLTREQLIDVAILIGTDFNEGVRGIGPKRAVKLIKTYGGLEALPGEVRAGLPENYEEIRELYLNPEILEDYEVCWNPPDEEGLRSFLRDERGFSPRRVETLIKRVRRAYGQRRLEDWL